jgi:hypothetical protein
VTNGAAHERADPPTFVLSAEHTSLDTLWRALSLFLLDVSCPLLFSRIPIIILL